MRARSVQCTIHNAHRQWTVEKSSKGHTSQLERGWVLKAEEQQDGGNNRNERLLSSLPIPYHLNLKP